MRYTPSGRPVTSFSVATSRTWVSAEGERREETEWFNVVAWGNLAEICKAHLSKNQQVYVEGRLQTAVLYDLLSPNNLQPPHSEFRIPYSKNRTNTGK